jgi:hypothetical protein
MSPILIPQQQVELVTKTKTREIWNVVFKAFKDISHNVALGIQ